MLTSLAIPLPPLSKLNFSCRNSCSSTRSTSDESDHSQSRGGLSRFFSDALPYSKGGVVRIKGDEFVHMTKVLRLAVDGRLKN